MKIKNMLYVGILLTNDMEDMFESYQQIEVVENEFAREHDTKIFLLKGGLLRF